MSRDRQAEAHRLVAEALHLRQYGERAPGGNETWREWDRKADLYLRSFFCDCGVPDDHRACCEALR